MVWEKMMRKFVVGMVAASIACTGIADNQKDDPNYYRPSSYKMTKAAKVTVTIPSKRNDYDPKEDCKTFVVRQRHAVFFFSHAKPVSESTRMHESDFSSCEADGTIRFVDGDTGKWTIKRNGIAYLEILNGNSKGQVVILHCKKCEDWDL